MVNKGAIVARDISCKIEGLVVEDDELELGIVESELCGDTEGRIVAFTVNVVEGVNG